VIERQKRDLILENVLIESDGEEIRLTGKNAECQISTTAPLPQAFQGAFTVNCQKLTTICNSISEDTTLKMELKDNTGQLIVKANRSRWKLGVLPASDYPGLSAFNTATSISVSSSALLDALDAVLHAMADGDARYYLNGLLLEFDQNRINLVATDGHRLSKASLECLIAGDAVSRCILPRKTILLVRRLLSATDTTVTICLCKNDVLFTIENIAIVCTMIDGQFPDYHRVIPSQPAKIYKLDRKAAIGALNRTAVIVKDARVQGVRLTLKDGEMIFESRNQESNEESVDQIDAPIVHGGNEEVSIGYNVQYMMEALKALNSDTILFGISDDNSKATLRGEDDADQHTLQLVMQMRL